MTSRELPLNPMTIDEIKHYLPHRYPFLLIDRVTEFEKDKRIVAIKNVTVNEPFFPGHFPHYHVMPGVLIVEAMAQTGAIAVLVVLLYGSLVFGLLPSQPGVSWQSHLFGALAGVAVAWSGLAARRASVASAAHAT